MVKYLGKKNICLSVGSACSKGKPSNALLKAFKISPEE
jgi:cysteine sulfinate desulfinase/cysteine desulfurase-like protein